MCGWEGGWVVWVEWVGDWVGDLVGRWVSDWVSECKGVWMGG